MKLLFLDDNAVRTNFVSEFLRKRDFNLLNFEYCYTASDAVNKLTPSSKWDAIFLDHDLGDEIYANSAKKNTGAEVTRHILKNKLKNTIGAVIVHSFNPSGAEVMCSNLIKAGLNPIIAPYKSAVFLRMLDKICEDVR